MFETMYDVCVMDDGVVVVVGVCDGDWMCD